MSRRRFFLLTLLLPALLLFFRLDYAPFWNPDEGRYSAASYEMAFGFEGRSPDWLVPHLDTVTRLNKPPLVYWATASMFRLWGFSEVAGRLPMALAALSVMALLFFWGRAAFGTRAGWGAALVWATAIFPFAMARMANTDMLLCAAMTLTGFGLFWTLESSRKGLFGAVAGLGIGLSVLAKGPVGVALPLAVVCLYWLLVLRGKRAPWGAWAIALAVGLVLGAPWFVLVAQQRPHFLKDFLFDENLKRFSGAEAFHKPTSKLFYLPVLLGGMLPWTGFSLPALTQFEPLTTRPGRAKVFLLIWAGFIALFFSFSGTKLVSYVLPAFPALSLLTGVAVARFEAWPRAARRFALGITLFLHLVLALAVTVKPGKTLGPGVLLDDRIVPRSVGLPWAMGLVCIAVLGCAALLLAARRGNGKTVLLTQASFGGVLLVFVLGLAGVISNYEDDGVLIKALSPRLKRDDRVGVFLTFVPTAMVYAGRPVTFFGFYNSSGLDKTELKGSAFFRAPDDFMFYRKESTARTFILSEGPLWPPAAKHLKLWGRNNDGFLYSTAKKPADFHFYFVAPKKVDKPFKIPDEVIPNS